MDVDVARVPKRPWEEMNGGGVDGEEGEEVDELEVCCRCSFFARSRPYWRHGPDVPAHLGIRPPAAVPDADDGDQAVAPAHQAGRGRPGGGEDDGGAGHGADTHEAREHDGRERRRRARAAEEQVPEEECESGSVLVLNPSPPRPALISLGPNPFLFDL